MSSPSLTPQFAVPETLAFDDAGLELSIRKLGVLYRYQDAKVEKRHEDEEAKMKERHKAEKTKLQEVYAERWIKSLEAYGDDLKSDIRRMARNLICPDLDSQAPLDLDIYIKHNKMLSSYALYYRTWPEGTEDILLEYKPGIEEIISARQEASKMNPPSDDVLNNLIEKKKLKHFWKYVLQTVDAEITKEEKGTKRPTLDDFDTDSEGESRSKKFRSDSWASS